MPKKFVLTASVWNNATEQLKEGQVVTFDDDEPTGIYVGRVRELTTGEDAIEVASPTKSEINQAAKEGQQEQEAERKQMEQEAEKPADLSKPVPVPPPAPTKK